jgi:hypothetical protein
LIIPAHPDLFTSDPTCEYFNSKKVLGYRLGGYRVHVLTECFLFFSKVICKKDPPTFLFQIARGSGATPIGYTFLQKSALHLEVLIRTFQGFSSKFTRINLVST